MVLDGEKSEPLKVRSGVSQGTEVDHLLFLFSVQLETFRIHLFADDTLLYHRIDDVFGQSCLQHDLEALDRWSKVWQTRFSADKYHVCSMCKRSADLTRRYSLNVQILSDTQWSKYYTFFPPPPRESVSCVGSKHDITWLESVQRKAACFVTGNKQIERRRMHGQTSPGVKVVLTCPQKENP